MHRLAAPLLAALCLAGAAQAQAPAGKLTIVTSFSKDVTEPFKAAFEKAQPQVQVDVQNRNTNAAVKYLQETKANNAVDIMWASAPDAFEALKEKGLLQKYKPKAAGIPEKIGAYPVNDPDGMYSGFAASGYGIMWNTRYVAAKKLPEPKEWTDLGEAAYFDHVSMAAPSRSGTTHLTIETILQGDGWEQGWRVVKEMSGNFRQITERSFGVPDAVNSGQAGYGVVIDFFAFSSQASGFPVKFVYPSVTTIVPANVAIVANAPNAAAAQAFVEFLLSPAGQEVLLEKGIRRLPVNPAIYAKAPDDYPNPFKDPSLGARVKFDVGVSQKRNNVVDALYDQTVTFQHEGLKAATKAIHDAEVRLAKKDHAQARGLVGEARGLVAAVPITETEAAGPELAAAFAGGQGAKERQAEIEQKWAAFARERYAQAKAKAEEALKLAR